MNIPSKALRIDNVSMGDNVPGSAHKVKKVSFIMDGRVQQGFFKELDIADNFPALLVYMSGSTSVYLDSFQGNECTPAEYLVYSDDVENPQLLGLVSTALKDFVPFKYAGEPLESGENREAVIPSTKTLVKNNFIRILFNRWYLNDDDFHPHNGGLAGGIDFDMFWYWFVIHMKGARIVVDPPKKRINLTVNNYERFPDIEESAPYHWVTFDHPGEKTTEKVYLPESVKKTVLSILPKAYADPQQFRALAGNPEAQAQKVAAALQALVTYQPDVLRKRLEERFDKLTLNYTALPKEICDQYTILFPELCNAQTNKEPFIDFMMKIYQMHYDNLYRVVVFYMGCKDNGFGVPLAATHQELYTKPSLYKNIVEWVKQENASETHRSKNNPLQLDELKKRYHQIWRDSYTPRIRQLIYSSRNLAEKLKLMATTSSREVTVKLAKETTDSNLTEAWQLFGSLDDLDISLSLVCVDEGSNVHQGAILAIQFTNKLQEITNTYYKKAREHITDADNYEFIVGLRNLHAEYELSLPQTLNHATSYADEFFIIQQELRAIETQANFQRHLVSSDEQMRRIAPMTIKKDVLPITHPEVAEKFNNALFDWVDKLRSDEFITTIGEIIDDKYTPTLGVYSLRRRGEPVKNYLQRSLESNSNKLAYILTSAESGDDGALNTLIIQHLSTLVLQGNAISSAFDVSQAERFEDHLAHFVKSAVNFANIDRRFSHLCNKQSVELFYSTLYDWLSQLAEQELNQILNTALTQYEKGLSVTKSLLFGNRSKKNDIRKTFNENKQDPARALAITFMKSEKNSTSSEWLLQEIVSKIKMNIIKDPDLLKDPGYHLIDQYDPTSDHKFYLKWENLKNKVTVSRMQAEQIPSLKRSMTMCT
jgi:hypothetical protein